LLEEAAAEAARRKAMLEGLDMDLRTAHIQQSALARLGRSAISSHNLDAFLAEVVSVVVETLGTDRSLIADLQPDGGDPHVRASLGWEEEVPRPCLADDEIASVLQTRDVVFVPDASALPRESPAFRALGIQGWAGVAVANGTRPWGLLLAGNRTPRPFRVEDAAFLSGLASLMALAIARDHLLRDRQREHECLDAIFANIPVMISVFDPEYRLERVNPEWERTLGWSLAEARQIDIMAAAYPDPETQIRARQFVHAAERRWADFQVRTKDGRRVDTAWMRIRLSDGSRLGFGLDVTARNAVENERACLLEAERTARGRAEAALDRLRAIQSITEPALSELSLDGTLQELLTRLRQALGSDTASVFLLDEEQRLLYARAAVGAMHPNLAALRIPVGKSMSGLIVSEGRPLIVDDYGTVDVSGLQGVTGGDLQSMAKSGMGAPLKVGERIIGVVGVSSSKPRRFTADELDLLLLVAARLAPAIERGRLLDALQAGRAQEMALAQRLFAAQEEERRRIAVELHDELGQALTAVKITLESLARLTGRTELSGAIDLVDRTMDTVRDLALHVRPAMLDDLGLAAALRWYADRFARETGLEIQLSIDAVGHLESGLETACFRVVQEALTNVVRHARARKVWVDLRLAPGSLELGVRDDGVGFDVAAARQRAARGAAMGLLGMQERISLLGGRFEVDSSRDRGTQVRATLPVAAGGTTPWT
jgi:PAS domain S-box-containing protein